MTIVTSRRTVPVPPSDDASLEERLMWCAYVAQLAPSKHNSQPWRLVVRDGALWLWPELSRTVPLTDPSNRELLLSCGAAAHLATVAARALGRVLDIAWLPEPGGRLLARLTEGRREPATEQDQHLLRAVFERRTDRGPLDASSLPTEVRVELRQAALAHGADLHLVEKESERRSLAELVAQADRLLVRSGAVDEELAAWRRDPQDVRRDGVPTDHTRGAAASYRAEFVQRDFSAGAGTPALMDRAGTDAPWIMVLGTTGDHAGDWLLGGRALAAVLLHASAHGAQASYLNQPCEVPALRVAMRAALSMDSHPQVVLRIGRGGDVPPTPRRNAVEVGSR